MDEIKKAKIVSIEKARVTLDYDALEDWRRDDEAGLPICSFISFYIACGIEKYIREYCSENPGTQIAPFDNLSCNFYTFSKIKNLISKNWKKFPITIREDNKVIWDVKKGAKGQRLHKPLTRLPKKITQSIALDFMNFCPTIDDDLEDDVLVFTIFEKHDIVTDDSGEELEVIGNAEDTVNA